MGRRTVTAQEQDSPLAALMAAVADGKPVTALDKAVLRLKVISGAKERGLSWAAIGSVYGRTAKEMKRDAHKLAARVKRDTAAKVTP